MKACVIGDPESCHVRNRVGYLENLGYEIDWLCNRIIPVEGYEPKLIQSKFKFKFLAVFDYVRKLTKAIGQTKADFIHLHYASPYELLACMLSRKPYVVSLMGNDVLVDMNGLFGRTNTFLMKKGLAKADLITAKTPYLIEEAERIVGKKLPIINIIWGVDCTEKAEGVPRETGSERKIIFSPRALQEYYNIDMIVKALIEVRKHNKNIELWLCEFNSEAVYKNLLIELIDVNGLASCVKWIPEMSQSNLLKMYKKVDLLISVPKTDGFSQTILEGMLLGVPSIVGKDKTYQGLLGHDDNAFLVDKEVSDISRAITSLLEDHDRYMRISKAASLWVIENANLAKNLELLDNSIKVMLDEEL